MPLNRGIITFKRNPINNSLNGGDVNYTNANFKTVASGSYDNPLIWNVQNIIGVWVPAEQAPDLGNSIFIEATHTVTLNFNQNCKDFNFFNGEALNKINTGAGTLNIYGVLRRYTGTAPGTTITSGGGNGTTQWMIGNFQAVGTSRSQTVESFVSASNLYGFIFTINLNDSTQQFSFTASTSLSVNFGGTLNVSTGILFMSEAQIRVSQTQPASGIQDGVLNINNGGTVIWSGSTTGQMVSKAATVANGAFNLNTGGIFKNRCSNATPRIRSITNTLLGDLYMDLNGAQSFAPIADTTNPVLTYFNVFLAGGGTKTITANIVINGKLSLNNGVVFSAGGPPTCTYGTNGNIEILENRTRGNELPTNQSGANICKDLIVTTGNNYNLNTGTVNIRGVLTGGGTTSNGTLVQNHP